MFHATTLTGVFSREVENPHYFFLFFFVLQKAKITPLSSKTSPQDLLLKPHLHIFQQIDTTLLTQATPF